MKPSIIIFCFVALLPYRVLSQTVNITADTTVYGSVVKNFPCGQIAYNKFLADNAHYPSIAREYQVMGCTLVRFVIEKDSSLSKISLYSGIGSGTDQEALRLIRQSGKWIPEQVKGVTVRTRCIVPLFFTLEHNSNHQIKECVYGVPDDTNRLAAIVKMESLGVPVSEAPDYLNRAINFLGKRNGSKGGFDSVFVLSCSDYHSYNTPKTMLVVFMGKEMLPKQPNPKHLEEWLISGTGVVLTDSSTGVPFIVVNKKSSYRLLQPNWKFGDKY